MKFAYLLFLLFSIASMVLIDKRFTLAFFYDKVRTVITIAIGVMLFIIWDAAGIVFNIFYSPGSAYATGWFLAPDFPVEELFFLIFLCYFTLILYVFGTKVWPRM